MVYLSYKKSSNNRKNLQHYSQDVNYYETVKKVHKKVIKNFYHLTTCTLPVYGNQMNRASLSRLIEFDESIKLPDEEPGYEFGYTPFQELPLASVTVIEEVIISENQGDQLPGSLKIQHNDPIAKDIEIKLPLTNSRMKELQEQDPLVGRLRKQWSERKLDKKHFTMEDEI